MEEIKIYNQNLEELSVELIFSFFCKETQKSYVAVDNKKKLFEDNSTYNNLDILEIKKQDSKHVLVSNIPESDWEAVKKALQYEVFAAL